MHHSSSHSHIVKPPKIKKQIPSVNNYFLTVPNTDLFDADDGARARTPANIKRSNSVAQDMFGRKFSNHRRSVENLQAAQGHHNNNVNVAEIGNEIRSQLDQAKSEISSL